MKYEIKIYKEFGVLRSLGELGGLSTIYVFDTWDEVSNRVKELKENERVVSILEYHLVYKHPIVLPPSDEIHPFTNHEVYKDWIRTPKEDICTAKQKSYKDNFIEEDYFNYCLEYDVLTKHEFGYITRTSAVYDLNNSDRKAIMYELYQHSKSKQIFNLCFYQYRTVSIDHIPG